MVREGRKLERYFLQFDYLLLLLVLLTTGFGLVVLWGATHGVGGLAETKATEQATWCVVSLFIFAGSVLFPYRWLKWIGWPLYLFILSLLVLLFVAAKANTDFGGFVVKAGGAVSWLDIPLPGRSPLRVQPAEFSKIAMVIVLAQWLAWRRDQISKLSTCIPESIVPLAVMVMPMVFILLQPDAGTAAIFVPIPFILLFLAGMPWRIFIGGMVLGGSVAIGGLYYVATAEEVPFLRKHQIDRIRTFAEPMGLMLTPLKSFFRPPGVEEVLYGVEEPEEEKPEMTRVERLEKEAREWNSDFAEMALGSGQTFGKNWGNGTLSRWRFLPAHHTDFIYSSLGEQFGFVGCTALLVLYLLIIWRVVHIIIVCRDPFGRFMVAGLLCIVLIHVFQNIGMVLRLLPVAGIPLPLVSYGGSFLATNYLIFGLIANVGMRREEPPGN